MSELGRILTANQQPNFPHNPMVLPKMCSQETSPGMHLGSNKLGKCFLPFTKTPHWTVTMYVSMGWVQKGSAKTHVV